MAPHEPSTTRVCLQRASHGPGREPMGTGAWVPRAPAFMYYNPRFFQRAICRLPETR